MHTSYNQKLGLPDMGPQETLRISIPLPPAPSKSPCPVFTPGQTHTLTGSSSKQGGLVPNIAGSAPLTFLTSRQHYTLSTMLASVRISVLLLLAARSVIAYDAGLRFKSAPEVESRTTEEIYQAALDEGGVVTCWHGGDEANQQEFLKQAFEERFPGMTLNLTVDLSKYHDGRIDQQLADGNVYVDSVILQTLHDFPRWASQGALLNYAPLGFEAVEPAYKDSAAAWYGVFHVMWQLIWSTSKLPNVEIAEFDDFLKPELKNKLVLTYPNDDDAVLFAFDLIMQEYGIEWLDALLAQNPRWVRGTATPMTLMMTANQTEAATFTSFSGFGNIPGVNWTIPTKAQFVSWPQTAAILKDAPHPEGAKLLHAFLLSPERQQAGGWPVRRDVPLADDFPLPGLDEVRSTNATAFGHWMADRSRVERLRFWLEDRIGTAQGLSPLVDDL
ncbi:hypothetical protein DL764_006030 [Monosporascus ibericus]|uniref:ABC-type Fe3+ transport system n=1 Tax=Monosporascus ibericus TaxID=155417 RepID=A0A4Q4T9N8_9PEZI|nr:hypothetical protein DL764_006030 [Monosporascus ibericus]